MARLVVTGAVAVLPTADGREVYLYKNVIFDEDAFTEKGVEHARSMGLVDDAPELPEEDETQTLSAADVEAAAQLVEAEAQKVADAKAELERERQALETEKADLAKEREEFDAAKAKAPAAKQTAAKQS